MGGWGGRDIKENGWGGGVIPCDRSEINSLYKRLLKQFDRNICSAFIFNKSTEAV